MAADAGRILAELGVDIGGAEKSLGTFGRLLQGIGAGIQIDLGRRLLDLGGELASAGFRAAKFADTFDRAMIQSAAVLPPVAGGAKALRDRLEELSRTTPVALEELSQGLLLVARSGAPSATAAFTQLQASTKLARLSGQDLTTTISALDRALDAFGLPASKAAEAVDALAVAARAGVNLDELGPILERVGAQAAAAGISMDETVAAIVALVETGVPVKQAGAIFTQSLGGVVAEGDDASVAASRLGVRLEVVNGQLRFSGRGAELFASAMADMQSKAGEADRQLAELSGTLGDQATIVSNELKVAWADFGTAVTPIVTTLLKAVSGFMEVVTGRHGAQMMAVQLRELAGGWRDMSIATTDAARATANANRGADRQLAAMDAFALMLGDVGFQTETFRAALRLLPEQDLPALGRALRSLTAEERAQMGVTQEDINQMLHLIGLARQAARAVASARPDEEAGPRAPAAPPISADLQKAITETQRQLGALDQMGRLLGDTFDRAAAEADVLKGAIQKLSEAGATETTVVGKQGETLGQLAARYRSLALAQELGAAKEERLKELRAEAAAAIQSVLTPQQLYEQGVLRLNEMLKNHLITQEQYNLLIEQLGVTTSQTIDITAELQRSLSDAIGTLAEGVGDALAGLIQGQKTLGQALIQVIGATMVSLGRALIAFGLAGLAIKKFALSPGLAIAAGAALIALGTLLSKTATATVERGLSAGGGGAAAPAPQAPTQAQAGEAAPETQLILEFQDPSNPAVVQRIVASANRLHARDATPVVSVPLAVVSAGR